MASPPTPDLRHAGPRPRVDPPADSSRAPTPRLVELELDLDVFAGPFDLLLSIVLRDELDLLEVELAEIVVAYIDHLEAAGELDLEAATEFLVLIAALLELKSRLMLPGDDALDELGELAPGEAAEELLERMLQYATFRGAGGWMAAAHAAGQAYLHRSAPLPPALRRVAVESAERAYDADVLGQAIGGLLRTPPPIDVRHIAAPRVSVADRLAHLRGLLAHGRFSFDEAVDGADRVTVAVTLFALLELYKSGEAGWEQEVPFGPITVRAERTGAPGDDPSEPDASSRPGTVRAEGAGGRATAGHDPRGSAAADGLRRAGAGA